MVKNVTIEKDEVKLSLEVKEAALEETEVEENNDHEEELMKILKKLKRKQENNRAA